MIRNPTLLRRAINDEAHRLGFGLVGVTTPEPPPQSHLAAFEDWLTAGRHGEMAYLASERSRQRRADPRQIMPECRSILVLATPYWSPGVVSDPPHTLLGRVAAYAWGADYHDVLVERLQDLAAFIQVQVGRPVGCRWYTDSGPLLERSLAQRAGLGWIGKNTCLIHPKLGSYFFLAELLLDIDLQPDMPFTADRCGSCTRCIDACPTACILPDRILDAQHCISYLTIELKGTVPPELRSKIGHWVFGCDICQQVCPWNRFAVAQGEQLFAPRPGVPAPDLLQEISLGPDAFNQKFKGSPVKRAKRRGYLRNVAVALGNAGHRSAKIALEQALQVEADALIREHVIWALRRLGETVGSSPNSR